MLRGECPGVTGDGSCEHYDAGWLAVWAGDMMDNRDTTSQSEAREGPRWPIRGGPGPRCLVMTSDQTDELMGDQFLVLVISWVMSHKIAVTLRWKGMPTCIIDTDTGHWTMARTGWNTLQALVWRPDNSYMDGYGGIIVYMCHIAAIKYWHTLAPVTYCIVTIYNWRVDWYLSSGICICFYDQ